MSGSVNSNPCLYCDCYDPDLGCTMSPLDRYYACPLYDDVDSDDLIDYIGFTHFGCSDELE